LAFAEDDAGETAAGEEDPKEDNDLLADEEADEDKEEREDALQCKKYVEGGWQRRG